MIVPKLFLTDIARKIVFQLHEYKFNVLSMLFTQYELLLDRLMECASFVNFTLHDNYSCIFIMTLFLVFFI